MRGVSAGIGGVFLLIAIAIGLVIEALIPGFIIHLISGWTMVKSVVVWVGAQLAIVVAVIIAGGLIALAVKD